MDDNIRIIKSQEDSGVLVDGVTETVKDEVKKAGRWIYWCIVSTDDCFIDANCGCFIGKTYRFIGSSIVIEVTNTLFLFSSTNLNATLKATKSN